MQNTTENFFKNCPAVFALTIKVNNRIVVETSLFDSWPITWCCAIQTWVPYQITRRFFKNSNNL